jgi:hypothetical protein
MHLLSLPRKHPYGSNTALPCGTSDSTQPSTSANSLPVSGVIALGEPAAAIGWLSR